MPGSVPSPAVSVLQILQRYRLALVATGLGLSVATPAHAAELNRWVLSLPRVQTQPEQVAYLPSLAPPPVQRVYSMTAERRAMLNTIRYSEGTWVNGHPIGYTMLFGGSYVGNLDRHPNRVMYSTRYASAAAGAYQFMPTTWSLASQALGLPDFRPDSQDQAALFLIERRGALGLVDRGELTPELTARLSPEWASFPTLAGSSYYGQPVQRFADLRRFYEDNLAQLRQAGQGSWGSGGWQTVAIRQLPPPIEPIKPDVIEQADSSAATPSYESTTGRLDPSGRF